MRIYIEDVRRVKNCAKGCRAFLVRHNFSIQDFLKNGIDADELRATNDHMAIMIIESAEKWQAEKSKLQDTNITPR